MPLQVGYHARREPDALINVEFVQAATWSSVRRRFGGGRRGTALFRRTRRGHGQTTGQATPHRNHLQELATTQRCIALNAQRV